MSSDGNLPTGCRLAGTMFLAAGIGLSVIGCSSVPNTDAGPLEAIPSFDSKAKQGAFQKQVENDPFPMAGSVGL